MKQFTLTIQFIITNLIIVNQNINLNIYLGKDDFLFRMTFTLEAILGGHVVIENREKNINETHHFLGTTKTLQYLYRWDFILPYHCFEVQEMKKNCTDPLTLADLTENVRL